MHMFEQKHSSLTVTGCLKKTTEGIELFLPGRANDNKIHLTAFESRNDIFNGDNSCLGEVYHFGGRIFFPMLDQPREKLEKVQLCSICYIYVVNIFFITHSKLSAEIKLLCFLFYFTPPPNFIKRAQIIEIIEKKIIEIIERGGSQICGGCCKVYVL